MASQSTFGTVAHDLHKLRRSGIDRFFSKAAVNRFQPTITEAVQLLCRQLEIYAGSGKPIKINMAFSCMTSDIMMQYGFNKSYHFLDNPGFEPNFNSAIDTGQTVGLITKHVPVVMAMMELMPQ